MPVPAYRDAQQRGMPGELFARESQARPRLRRSCRGCGLRWRRGGGNCGTQDRTPIIDWASPRPAVIALGSGSCIGLLSRRRRPLPRLPFLELFFLALHSVRAHTLVLALDGVAVAAAFRWVVSGQFDVERIDACARRHRWGLLPVVRDAALIHPLVHLSHDNPWGWGGKSEQPQAQAQCRWHGDVDGSAAATGRFPVVASVLEGFHGDRQFHVVADSRHPVGHAERRTFDGRCCVTSASHLLGVGVHGTVEVGERDL